MSQELTSLAHMAELQETSKVEVIVYTKSDKTLKQNMNAKDETLRKRTSLIIVPQQVADDQEEEQQQQKQQHQLEQLENGNRNSIASMDSCLSSQSNQSSPDAGIDADGDGGNSTSSSSSSSSEDAHAAYQDLQNGNGGSNKGDGNNLGLHSPSCSSSSTSSESSTSCCSSVDYSLREQLQNFANCSEVEQLQKKCVNDLPTAAQLLKGMSLPMEQAVSPHCDALLSPQEVPLGRRYAEVAQFKALSNKAR